MRNIPLASKPPSTTATASSFPIETFQDNADVASISPSISSGSPEIFERIDDHLIDQQQNDQMDTKYSEDLVFDAFDDIATQFFTAKNLFCNIAVSTTGLFVTYAI